MNSLIRRIPSTMLVFGLYLVLLTFAVLVFKNPV